MAGNNKLEKVKDLNVKVCIEGEINIMFNKGYIDCSYCL